MNSRARFDERRPPDRVAAVRASVRSAHYAAQNSAARRLQNYDNFGVSEPELNSYEENAEITQRSNEVTVGVTGILLLLLLLAITCGGFFLYGYNLGHNAAQTVTAASSSATDPNFGSFKPSPVSPALQPILGYDANGNAIGTSQTASSTKVELAPSTQTKVTAQQTESTEVKDSTVDANTPVVADNASTTPISRLRVRRPISLGPTAFTTTSATSVARPAMIDAGPFFVQVAAVSHAEDSDVLLSSLLKRGYTAMSTTSPQDNLIHVQLGPFINRQEAIAMEKKLSTDGFHAVIQ